LSAQYDRGTARALVCGALLVYGCLRIPAAAQPAQPPDAELQKRTESVRKLEAGAQERLDGVEAAGVAHASGG
jgi:hypothetical protein